MQSLDVERWPSGGSSASRTPKLTAKKAFKRAVGKLAGAAGLYGKAMHSKMVILAFHRVNDEIPEDGLTCSSGKFEHFCQFFGQHFKVVRLADQIRAARTREFLGGTVSITFDDGYLDNFEVAAPILRRHGLPATFFVTTGFIGGAFVPYWDRDITARLGWMTWDQVRLLSEQGFDIGSHTDTHIDMASSAPDAVLSDLLKSRERLRVELGMQADLLAYPFGGYDQVSDRAFALVRQAGFAGSVSCYGGTNTYGANPYNLKRIGVSEWYKTPAELGFDLILGRI